MESFATHGETEAVMKLRQTFTCPLELTHDMIKGKWKPIILWRLRLGKTTLAQLERDIDGITQKMLLEHLKELTAFGFVDNPQGTEETLALISQLDVVGEQVIFTVDESRREQGDDMGWRPSYRREKSTVYQKTAGSSEWTELYSY